MRTKLLIRAYNVGCGDCIYVRIPEGKDGVHILIDCGRKGGAELLKKAIDHLASDRLPDSDKPGKKRLDLVVATHRHEDHIKGFDPECFKNIDVKNIWLSKVMDPAHPQAKKVNKLHAFAGEEMRKIAESTRAMSPEIEMLAALYRVSNEEADKLLMETLPAANQIQPKFVCSGQSGKDLGFELETAEINVLAPEADIDHYYLGAEADSRLKAFHEISSSFTPFVIDGAVMPQNISAADFRLLRSRMLSNGLAFAAKDTSIQNNMSVVLLIEWRKKRLLFVGDAEWHGEFREGKQNGSWNVMWEKYRNSHLKKPLDFLKVGHHGSINATPPPKDAKANKSDGVYEILDALLPLPKNGRTATAKAIVSTEREFYNPIPEGKLLVDIGRRISNSRNYGKHLREAGINTETIWVTEKARREKFFEKYEKDFLDLPQPWRTDLECALSGKGFVDVEIDA